jgi:hypothetical protein
VIDAAAASATGKTDAGDVAGTDAGQPAEAAPASTASVEPERAQAPSDVEAASPATAEDTDEPPAADCPDVPPSRVDATDAPELPVVVAELPLPAYHAAETDRHEHTDPEAHREPQPELARTWSTPTPVLPAADRPAGHAFTTPELVPDDDDDDDAYGADVVAAAEAVLQGESAAPQTDPEFGDDHDGLTILSSDLVAIRDQLPSWAGDEVPGPFRVVAPEENPAAKLVLSTGLVVTLDRSVLLGRAPQVSRVTNRELPRLVTVPSPQQDISRTHAEVRAEGDDVLVTDLHSTNGVLVSRPGERARRLHPGEATVVAAGEVVDLGDGVTFTVERGA